MQKDTLYLYMSQWALHGGAPGLSLFTFNQSTGALAFVRQLDDARSFGCSQVDPEKNILYICNETNLVEETGYDTGRIYGFRIDPETGGIGELFRRDTFCPFPDYIGFDSGRKFMIVPHHSWATGITNIERDETGKFVPVTRYMDSAIDLFSMKPDGTIDDLVDVRKHSFQSRTTDFEGRVTVPHPHCAVRSPSGKLFAICDKGDCHIYLYRIDEEKQELQCLNRLMTDVPLSEPRYCAFHPTLPYLFVNHEHTGHGRMTVTALRYDEDGNLWPINKVDCLPQDYTGPAVGQGFCISPDGKYLYNLLQGICAVAVLEIEQITGEIRIGQLVPVNGGKPRNCALSPNGRFLITACLTGEIAVYAVGPDGRLTATEHGAYRKGSAYITFYEPK